MKKQYWYAKATYQDILRVTSILIWIFLGIWILLDSWQFNSTVQTSLIILPVNMIALTFVHWYLQQKSGNNARQDRQLLIFFALIIISFTAIWVYEI
jgi:Kef-type K+ transport system membrane component KefB